jgi:hypothetical protein
MSNVPDTQAQVTQYMTLLQQGVPNKTAFYQVWPNGIPTAQQKAATAAAAKQQAAYGQVGGMLTGALGAKLVFDGVTGKGMFAPGGTGSKLINSLSGSGSGAASGGGTGASTPVLQTATENSQWGGNAGVDLGANASTEAGGESATSGAAEAAPGFFAQAPGTTVLGSETAGAALPAAGYIAGAYTAYQSGKGAYDAFHGKKLNWKEQAALALPTFGGSLVYNYIPGLTHETTRAHEKKTWDGIANNAPDPTTAAYAAQYRQYLDSDQAKEDAKKDPQALLDAGQLKGKDIWGGAGVINTFGSDWLNHYTADQREKIAQGLIDNKLVGFHKGVDYITDPAKAQAIAATIAPPSAPQAPTPPPAVTNGKQPYKPSSNYQSAQVKQTGQFGNQLVNALAGNK